MDLIAILVTLVAIFAAAYYLVQNNLKYLKDHWVELRCNPLYMPAAGLVDPKTGTMGNALSCMSRMFQDLAGYTVDPLLAEMSTVGDGISEIGGALDDMRGMFGSVRSGFTGILGMTFGKIQNLMGSMQNLMIKIRSILGKIVGVFMTLTYTLTGGIETGEAVMNGPIGKTMSFLCFDPFTPVPLKSGKTVPIAKLQLGEKLLDGGMVRSVQLIDGKDVEMFVLGGIIVSGNHKVKYNNRWIRVDEHPESDVVQDIPFLSCINTTSNRILAGGREFLDFVESSDDRFFASTQHQIEALYSNKGDARNFPKYRESLRTTGFFTGTLVATPEGPVPIQAVRIGQVLAPRNRVIGIVRHAPDDDWYANISTGILSARGTWVFAHNQLLIAAALDKTFYREIAELPILHQLITEQSTQEVQDHSGRTFTVLDEIGTTNSHQHEWKDAMICSGTFRGTKIRV